MITRRSCFECNQAKKELDTYVRDWAAIDSRMNYHPVARANMLGRVSRAIDRNQSPVRDGVIGPPLREVDFVTEAGIFVERAVEIPMSGWQIREWLRYVVQGLANFHFKDYLPPGYSHLVMQPDAQVFRETMDIFTQHREFHGPFNLGGDVVLWGVLALNPNFAVWQIVLYNRMPFTVAVLPPDQLDVMRKRAQDNDV
jgi:hypothetical protein